MPDEDGILFDTIEEAESAVSYMLMDFKRRGFTVTRSDNEVDGQRWYSVVDEARRPFGIYGLDIQE